MKPDPEQNQLSLLLPARRQSRLLRGLLSLEIFLFVAAFSAVLAHAGFVSVSRQRIDQIGLVVVGGMGAVALIRVARALISRLRPDDQQVSAWCLLAPVAWLLAVVAVNLFGVNAVRDYLSVVSAREAIVVFSELTLVLIALMGLLRGCRLLADRTQNSALLFVGSFLLLILMGTLLLRMPVCRPKPADGSPRQSAPWDVALFTATSASCVTGLIVEPTGTYWSSTGHAIIFALFQTGGLGILTIGAFVAILSGRRGIRFREATNVRELLDSDDLQTSRRLLLTILLFTLGTEAVGVLLLQGLWADQSAGTRYWMATFHSVSAFCNAGFSLHDEGFLDKGHHWQVWGPLSLLIILGGLGFAVVDDVYRVVNGGRRGLARHSIFRRISIRPRLSVHSRLVLWSAAALLISGAIGVFVLESLNPTSGDRPLGKQIADAWFQSVTFRTAGFNTTDHSLMHPATKLLAVFLMFIGAAPGSTGGGVKTVVFALTVLNVRAVFRGRPQVEVFGRRLPENQVSRALAIIGVGAAVVLITTGLLAVFEHGQEHLRRFELVDYLYEATSAFATVGVSTGITPELSVASRLLIVTVMFLGRVGPITLLLALGGAPDQSEYDYPVERVSLG